MATADPAQLLEQGLEHHQAGRHADARQAYGQVLEVDAGNSRALFLLGTLAAQEQDFAAAEKLIRRAIQSDPDDAAYYNNLGVVLREAGRLEEAMESYRDALARRPDYAEAHCNFGVALKESGRADEAVVPLERAIALDPEYGGAYTNLGNALHELDRFDEAMAAFDRALELEPRDPSAHFNRALAVQVLGDLDAARDGFRTVVRLHPAHAEAWRLLAGVTRFGSRDDGDLNAMLRLVADPTVSPRETMHLHFGISKALEDIGEYDAAFEHLASGNAQYRQTYDYDIEQDAEYFNAIKRTFSTESLADRKGWGDEATSPIFIVGMMRSGTTLVEQILVSHPDVAGAGELKELDRVTRRREATPDGTDYPESALLLDRDTVLSLGTTYVNALQRHGSHAQRITDKMPGNFQYIGLIRLLLPKAIVIHCVRDPVDTCLSCYRNYFSGFHPFAYDLEELGRYYGLYRDLMHHWQTVVPGFVQDIRYEDLVADPESQIRRLLEVCGLDWDENCLAFHQTQRPIRTNSAAQVRRPIYRSSVKVWKKFEKHLGPLLEGLGDHPT